MNCTMVWYLDLHINIGYELHDGLIFGLVYIGYEFNDGLTWMEVTEEAAPTTPATT